MNGGVNVVEFIANTLEGLRGTRVGNFLDSLMGDAYTKRLRKNYFKITRDISIGWTDRISLLFGDPDMYIPGTMCLTINYAKAVDLCFYSSVVLKDNIYQDGQHLDDKISI